MNGGAKVWKPVIIPQVTNLRQANSNLLTYRGTRVQRRTFPTSQVYWVNWHLSSTPPLNTQTDIWLFDF